TATAGQLSEGQDLLPQAGITVDQAIAAATGATQGALGDVELKTVDGTLVFEVQVGDQDVHVNAADGSIVSTDSGANDTEDSGCNDDAAATPGALSSGSELQSQATVTLDQAVAAAQGAATGQLGSVDLEMNDSGVLVYSVEIGTQEVSVDAQTGTVLEVVDANS
ncbi:MAG: PepSY domain-containing protein, partial [Thermomicrobiales bacterium]